MENLEKILKSFGEINESNKWQAYEYCKEKMDLNQPQDSKNYEIKIGKIVEKLGYN